MRLKLRQEFEADGIRYRIGGNYAVSVISKNEENSGIIVIPDQVNHNGTKYTVTSIAKSAFSSCSNLTHIISEIQNPFIINKNVFATNIYSSATLFVPYGKKDAYQSKDAWKKFQNITEKIMGDVNLNGEVNNKDLDALEDYIMGRNPENFFKVMADLNSDGLVNVADIVELVKIITGNNSK